MAALTAVLGLVVLAVLGPVLTPSSLDGPSSATERSAAIVAPGADAAVVAAPQPRSSGPLLLPLVLALVAGLLVLRAWARTTAPRWSAHPAGLDRWRARLVGAPPVPASPTSH